MAAIALTNDNPSAKKILCDNCDSEDAAQSRCHDCAIFLCQFCTESHKRYRSTKQHELLTVEELKSNPGPQKIAEKIRCSKHKEEVIKLFCKTCQTTICRDCTIVDHRQHEYGFVEEVAFKEKQHLESNLNEVKLRKFRVVEGIANLRKFNEHLEDTKNSTISEISQHFNELVKAAEFRKSEMIEKATSLTNSKQKQIRGQLEVLEVALATCESSIEFTELALKNGNDVQILSLEKNILKSLHQLKTVKDQTEPSVTEDMMFVIPCSVWEMKEILLNNHDVDDSPASPEKCHAYFNDDVTVLEQIKEEMDKYCKKERVDDCNNKETFLGAGRDHSITLICINENNRRLQYGGLDIKPSFTGIKVDNVTVKDNKDGSYTITFYPSQLGLLNYKVSINGIPAANCSLTKQVKWVMSNAYGKGIITDGGLTMKGDGRSYCCRVGWCCFESGVHTWKVQLRESKRMSSLFSVNGPSVEVGIIDRDEVNTDMKASKRKWVLNRSVHVIGSDVISVTVDMERKMLSVCVHLSNNGGPANAQNYPFNACKVLPFFACSMSDESISIVE